MAVRRGGHTAEIRRLSGVARNAIERERAQRARLYKRSRQLARSGRKVGLMSMAALVALSLTRKRRDRGADDKDQKRRDETAQSASDRKGGREHGRKHKRKHDRRDSRILELARLAVTTTRLWESAAARR